MYLVQMYDSFIIIKDIKEYIKIKKEKNNFKLL
jgi:hypothetical protein